MVTLDLASLSVRDANEAMRAAAARGEDIELLNPDARHHLGVGLVAPVKVTIKGSAGYFCAGLSHGARFEIESNVGWGVGDSLYDGSVVVGGNASAIAGVALARRRNRREGQYRLARGTGDEGGHAALLRQRQLSGRLHDVWRPHHHPGRFRRARRRGHERRRGLCRRQGAEPRRRRQAGRDDARGRCGDSRTS